MRHGTCGRGLAAAAITAAAVLGGMSPLRGDDWPQRRGPTRDGVWRETGLVESFAEPQLKLLWEAPIASGYSGPSVAGGRVYVTDRQVEPKQVERVHCFDAKTGKPLWSHSYDAAYRGVGYEAGPRASVGIHDGRAYSLGSMGHLICFDAVEGKILWQHDLEQEYSIEMPIWGVSAAPLIEGDLIVVQIGGKPGACVVAFDRTSGDMKWKALSDRGQYSAPIVVEQAGRRVIVVWTGDSVAGLAPADGTVLWRHELKPRKMPIGVATPVVHNGRLFTTSFYDGSLMLRLNDKEPTVEQLWRRVGADEQHTDALQSIIATPLFLGDCVYGVDSYGELRCLDAKTGDRLWEDRTATPRARWSTIHMVQNGERTWMFNERGELLIARLSPEKFTELSRAKLIEPTTDQLRQRGGVCWAHPAFADRCVFARNDKRIVCASLAAE